MARYPWGTSQLLQEFGLLVVISGGIHKPFSTEPCEQSSLSFRPRSPTVFLPPHRHLNQITSPRCSEPSLHASHFAISKSPSPVGGTLQDVLSLPSTFALYHSAVQATLVFSPEPVSLVPASGPLHWCFPLPGPLFLKYLPDSLTSFASLFKCHFPGDTGSKVTVPFLPHIPHVPSHYHGFQ